MSEPRIVKISSAFSPMLSPTKSAEIRIVNPAMPVKIMELFEWFLYPKLIAKMLTGIVNSNIALWISSLSTVNAKELYESIIKDGANRQWIIHIAENEIANLSDVSCDFIILKKPPNPI